MQKRETSIQQNKNIIKQLKTALAKHTNKTATLSEDELKTTKQAENLSQHASSAMFQYTT